MTSKKPITPTRKGQIVKICSPLPDEDPNESYLLAEDPTLYDDKKRLLIYSITSIMRSKHDDGMPLADQVQKGDLTVVGESLEEWVHNWNFRSN